MVYKTNVLLFGRINFMESSVNILSTGNFYYMKKESGQMFGFVCVESELLNRSQSCTNIEEVTYVEMGRG